MTVGELITKLQQFSPDARVIVSGYEGGYNDCKIIKQIDIMLNVNDSWYYGEHDDPKHDQISDCVAVKVS